MSLRVTLTKAHEALDGAKITHALIGGMGLATLGIHRATEDVDLMIPGTQKELAKTALTSVGFIPKQDSQEVIHFEGIGRLDLLLANRPLSLEMLAQAKVYPQHGLRCVSPEGIIGLKIQAYTNDRRRELQDKADIKSLIEKFPALDWSMVRQYADLFGEWETLKQLGAKP